MQQTLVRVSRIFLAVMFLFSGISKLLSMAFFDAMVAELFLGPSYYDHPTGLFYTQILSRLLIALELTLGAAVLVNKGLKKITLPALFGMLLLFTVHLFYEGLTSDKGFVEGNCGCFGDVLPMNNLESIIKNLVAMVAAVFVWLRFKDNKLSAWATAIVLGLVTLITLLMGVKSYQSVDQKAVEPEELVVVDTLSSELTTTKIIDTVPETPEPVVNKSDQQTKITDPTSTSEQPKNDIVSLLKQMGNMSDGQPMKLSKGDVVVCLFSMTCGHCQESYKELCELSAHAKLPKLYLVNYGQEFEQKYFFNQAGNCRHPYVRTEDYTKFNRMLQGKGFPRIIAFKDGKIVQDWNIDTYSKEVFMKHFNIEETHKNAEDGLNLQKKDDSFDDFEKKPWE